MKFSWLKELNILYIISTYFTKKIKYFTKRLKTVGADSETRRGEWGLRFANERLALSAALCQYGAHCRHLEQNWRTSIIGVDKRTAGAPLGDI